MKYQNERRQDQRAPISLPFEIKTTHGAIKGKTANISTGGLALLLNQESHSLEAEFKIHLNVRIDHETEMACKKRWSGEMAKDNAIYNAIGIQFIKV